MVKWQLSSYIWLLTEIDLGSHDFMYQALPIFTLLECVRKGRVWGRGCEWYTLNYILWLYTLNFPLYTSTVQLDHIQSIIITCHMLKCPKLTGSPFHWGTEFHSATSILVPWKLLSVSDWIKLLTAFNWDWSDVNCVYFTDPVMDIVISAANGAITEYELGPGKTLREEYWGDTPIEK